METIKKDDPVTLSKYAFGNNIIDKDIWKWASRYAKKLQEDESNGQKSTCG